MSAAVYGINDAGEAVGVAGSGTAVCQYGCAVIWHDGTPTRLVVEAAFGSQAIAINNAGQVIGNAYTTNALHPTAVVWNSGTPTLLPGPNPQYTYTIATSINDAGQVVGEAYPQDTSLQEAIEWNGSTPTVLDTKPGCNEGSYATGINSRGTVVGENICRHPQFPDAIDEATVWNGTTPALIGLGKAYAINNTGLVVGVSKQGPTAWVNGVYTLLAGGNSTAIAVNNHGIIVGTSPASRDYHAVLWSSVSAAPQDLNDLIGAAAAKEYVLTAANGINDNCTIVANGFSVKHTANTIAFLLKPIDPASCAKGLVAGK